MMEQESDLYNYKVIFKRSGNVVSSLGDNWNDNLFTQLFSLYRVT